MKHNDLDRILSTEQEIIPSSGFAASVMDAVRREAEAPPPIPFPWKRALLGLSAACLALAWVFVASFTQISQGTGDQPLPPWYLSALDLVLAVCKNAGATWIILALVLSLASVKLSMRFASAEH